MGDDPFAPYGLRPIELADRPTFDSHFATLARPLSDYTFGQLFTWRNSLRILWKPIRDHLCVFANGTGDLTLLMPPIGDTGSDAALAEAFELMDAYNADHGVPDRSRVDYASEELLSRLDGGSLDARPMGADYLYDVRRMIDLAGGDLSSKRQAKNRFLRNYQSRVETYSAPAHLDACATLLGRWKYHQDHTHGDEPDTNAIKRQKESLATLLSLESAEALGLRGMVVYVKDETSAEWQLRAFTFGEPLGRDQSSITIEKTDLETKGLAQFIFSEFCRVEWAGRPLVNVGDDWGLETLAWTKMSYRPVEMLRKFVVRKSATAAALMPAPMPMPIPIQNQIQIPTLTMEPLMAEPVIRAARATDVTAAEELERACFPESEFSLTKRQLRYLQRRPTAVFLVAEEGDQLVGEGIALVRQHRTGSSGRIYSLAVSADRRGQGIGRRLLERMVGDLSARGVKRIYLEVEAGNDAAAALYARFGFQRGRTLVDYYGPGKAAVQMMYEPAQDAVTVRAAG
jgi:ribosomal protein S18 acetylase RimI-like enzyme